MGSKRKRPEWTWRAGRLGMRAAATLTALAVGLGGGPAAMAHGAPQDMWQGGPAGAAMPEMLVQEGTWPGGPDAGEGDMGGGDGGPDAAIMEEGSLAGEEAAQAFLTPAQAGTREALKEGKAQVERMAGAGYEDGVAVLFASTREEAEEIAASYGAELIGYADEVAHIRFLGGRGTAEAFGDAIGALDALEEARREMAASGTGTEGLGPDGVMGADPELAARFDAAGMEGVPDVPAYPDIIFHLDAVNPGDDPLYSDSAQAPKGQWFHEAVGTPGAWAAGADGDGVTVAVIDTGIEAGHVDLAGNTAYYDTGASNWITSAEDDNGHGTHCAGIIMGNDNRVGGIGVAPKAKVLSIKAAAMDGRFHTVDIAEAIMAAKRMGADIISMSFGSEETSPAVRVALTKAMGAGILCIAAAGNSATGKAEFPASMDGVVSVAAYGSDGKLAPYSNYGPGIDIVAPGSDILSTIPNSSTAYLRRYRQIWDISEGAGCAYGKMSGTSMAVPVVAGIAALVKGEHPEYTAAQVREALIEPMKGETYKNSNGSATGGIDALKSLQYGTAAADGKEEGESGQDGGTDSGQEGAVDEWAPGKIDPAYYLAFGAGSKVAAKAGKTVDLRLRASEGVDIQRTTCTVSEMEGGKATGKASSWCFPTSKPGVYKIGKDAPEGATARAEAAYYYGTGGVLRTSAIITALPAKASSTRPKLSTSAPSALSVVPGIGQHAAEVRMEAGDRGRAYCFTVDKEGVIEFEGGLPFAGAAYGGPGTATAIPIKAVGPGTTTITAYACDGSGYKATIKATCVMPLATVQVTYKNAAIGDEMTMAKGASISLKAVGIDAGGEKTTGRTAYTWFGENVRSGKITAPKEACDFVVGVRAENNGIAAEKKFTVHVRLDKKLSYMGYYMKSAKGRNVYYNAVTSERDGSGAAYSTGRRYGIRVLPDLGSTIPKNAASAVVGPKGFTKNGAAPDACVFYDGSVADYATNEGGLYAISVAGPSVKGLMHHEDGTVSFVPGKKGKYKMTFTSLDGSGKNAYVILDVTADGSSSVAMDRAGDAVMVGPFSGVKRR